MLKISIIKIYQNLLKKIIIIYYELLKININYCFILKIIDNFILKIIDNFILKIINNF